MSQPSHDRSEPIACRLSPEEQAARAEQAKPLLAKVRSLHAVTGGYALDFGRAGEPDDPEAAALIRELGEFIARERACCPFFDYALEVVRNGGSVKLSVTGADETRPILDDFARELGQLRR